MTISWFEISTNNSWYASKLTNRKFYDINELYEYLLLNLNFWKSILQLPRFIELLKYSYWIDNKQDCANTYHGSLFYSFSIWRILHWIDSYNYNIYIYIFNVKPTFYIYVRILTWKKTIHKYFWLVVKRHDKIHYLIGYAFVSSDNIFTGLQSDGKKPAWKFFIIISHFSEALDIFPNNGTRVNNNNEFL